jgi:hypothetical protein
MDAYREPFLALKSRRKLLDSRGSTEEAFEIQRMRCIARRGSGFV